MENKITENNHFDENDEEYLRNIDSVYNAFSKIKDRKFISIFEDDRLDKRKRIHHALTIYIGSLGEELNTKMDKILLHERVKIKMVDALSLERIPLEKLEFKDKLAYVKFKIIFLHFVYKQNIYFIYHSNGKYFSIASIT